MAGRSSFARAAPATLWGKRTARVFSSCSRLPFRDNGENNNKDIIHFRRVRNDDKTFSVRLVSTTARNLKSMATNSKNNNGNGHPVFMQDMFCRQCEQTADHRACVTQGICGKTSETASCQDALMSVVQSTSIWATALRRKMQTSETSGVMDRKASDALHRANVWTLKAVFSTLTNVNFSDERIAEYARQGEEIKHEIKDMAGGESDLLTEDVIETADIDLRGMSTIEMEEFGRTVSVPVRSSKMNHEDAFALNELATYGLKGLCAYACHCHQLGVMDEDVMKTVHETFAKLSSTVPDQEGLLGAVLKVGETNGKVLSMLDGAHAKEFGDPEPTQVRTSVVAGKAILVSGHDLKDLHELLKQTEGTGVNVYTHGEMLPAHTYPGLKRYGHLAGNYGTAWQNQKFEFASFPGPIIVTTNCILEPRKIYKFRLYSMNETGVDEVRHIGQDRDFSDVIEQAKTLKGFKRTVDPPTYHTAGFNHRAVVPMAGDIIKAVQDGVISRIFLIGGCDGSQWERNYFTDLAEETPDDSVILTMGCAKNRVIHSTKLLNAKLSNGMPRVLDMGQCNDSYSAVVVATELAKALDCSVNDLPLSLAVSHMEQKAASVLLTLLSLGVKNIRLGPSLPAYLTPNVLNILEREYNLMGTGDVMQDLQQMMDGN